MLDAERTARALYRQAEELMQTGSRLIEEVMRHRAVHPDLSKYRFMPLPAQRASDRAQVAVWHVPCPGSRTVISVLDGSYGVAVKTLADWAAEHERSKHHVRDYGSA